LTTKVDHNGIRRRPIEPDDGKPNPQVNDGNRHHQGWCMDAEDVMARRWSDLSDRSRKLIIAAAIAEAILKTAVLIDIRRRPASQIRGSKPMWIVAAVLVNSAGVGPLSYFAFGRRQRAEGVELATPGEG